MFAKLDIPNQLRGYIDIAARGNSRKASLVAADHLRVKPLRISVLVDEPESLAKPNSCLKGKHLRASVPHMKKRNISADSN
jgi:hypothetical protein